MATQAQLKERFGLDIPAHIAESADVPILTGPQRQGDCYFRPHRPSAAKGSPVPSEGIALIRGEAMGNTHLLLPSEGVTFRRIEGDMLKVGVLDVEEYAAAWIHHIEHGYIGIGFNFDLDWGSYLVKGQREMGDVERRVAD